MTDDYDTYVGIVGWSLGGWTGMTVKIDYETKTISFDPVSFEQFLTHRKLKISVPDLNERDLAFPMARTIEQRLTEKGYNQ